MLSEVRLEGPKDNTDFGGKGIGMPTMQKGAILQKCPNTFVPHCSHPATERIVSAGVYTYSK